MSKSDKKLAKNVTEMQKKLAEYESIEHPVFKEHLTDLQTRILKSEMSKRADKIGK
jgi:hypothetical protein